jgi:A/G-specific adenine glycosylase
MTRGRNTTPPDPEFPFLRRLHRLLLVWYRSHGRELPWRDGNDPYEILVSEFMLQQTQVARVREHLPRWIQRFPTVEDLAQATRRDVLLQWSGMGYNRRALNLHAAAQVIAREHAGVVPSDPAVLATLPGIGRYTAHAVACFGHRRRFPMVDVNIRRILSRVTADMGIDSRMLPERETWRLAEALLPARAFFDWNQALMDLGAMVCTARRPACAECPLSTLCASAFRLAPDVKKIPGGHDTYDVTSSASTVVRETPRRIYRGRLIEYLRGRKGHNANADIVHRELFGCGDEIERARMMDILSSLERDGLIVLSRAGKKVGDLAAFTAPLRLLRVCLTE